MPETSKTTRSAPTPFDAAPETSKKAPMTRMGTQQTAGRQALAGAPRLGSGAGLACDRSSAVSRSWPAAASSMDSALIAFATKPATRMYVDVPNHRTRRLREPSP